jgi:anti-sigma regulatory factor (Ser/Thr protein kinase)
MTAKADPNIPVSHAELDDALKTGQSIAVYMEKATFVFETREEAKKIALHLASTMTDPVPALTSLLEILLNAIEHGSLGIGAELKALLIEQNSLDSEIANRRELPKYAARRVTLEYSVDSERYMFRVSDEGEGFDVDTYLKDCDASVGKRGRGIVMAQDCFDRLVYSDNGRTVELELLKQP